MSNTNTTELTPADLKTLQYFTIYCKSRGAESVYQIYEINDCNYESYDYNWYSDDTRNTIEGYERINVVIDRIISNINLNNFFDDCYNRGSLRVNIYCKERTLSIECWEVVLGSEPHGDEYSLEDIESEYGEETLKAIEELFEQLNGSEGSVDFSGGGDNGYIDDFMMVNENQVNIPKLIEEMLYSMLNGNHAGWENNEGAQGSWLFDPRDKTIVFDFNYNTEDEVPVDLDYEIRF